MLNLRTNFLILVCSKKLDFRKLSLLFCNRPYETHSMLSIS